MRFTFQSLSTADEDKGDARTLRPGDFIEFYPPHRTFGDPSARVTSEILSIVDGQNPLVLSSSIVLARQIRVRKLITGYETQSDTSDDESGDNPIWCFIDNYKLVYGGKLNHGTGVFRAATAVRKTARSIKRDVIRRATMDGYCLADALNY